MGSENCFLPYVLVKMLILNLYSHFCFSITLAKFYQISKLRIVFNSELPASLKMSKILILRAKKAKNLHFARWPKYWETPCR